VGKLKSEVKKVKKLHKINNLVLRYFITFSVIIVLLLSASFLGIMWNAYLKRAQNSLQTVGDNMARYIEQENGNLDRLQTHIHTLEAENAIRIVIITQNGYLEVPNDSSYYNDVNWEDYAKKITEKLQNADGDMVIYREGTELFYARNVRLRGVESYLFIRFQFSFYNDMVSDLQIAMLIAVILIILLSFCISYLVAQKLATPIKNLSSTASLLGKGDFSVKFTSAEYQEVAQLSDTLNYAKEEMKKSEDFQRELLANVSHDLKTPLTMIKAYASMVQEISGNNPEKRNQHLQVIIDEADRLTGLVNDVLSVSKISADIDQVNKKVFNLTEYLYSIIKRFDYLRETQGYTFMVDIDADLYTCADEEKIGQVFYNILSNAVNYTGEDKTVYISLKDDVPAARIRFAVRDTGKGISKEDLPSIWNRFYRVKEEHVRPVKGTGLGLSIVKTILDKHAFDFGAESELGKGTTFWVDFPEIASEIPAALPPKSVE
jgi:signal transduction histidine kinase